MYKRVILLTFLIGLSLSASSEKRGWLGVSYEEISEAAKIAIGVEYGVLVSKVIEESPAEKTGIKMGDVIMKIDGEKIEDREDLHRVVKKRPNKKVSILLFRRGKEKKADAVLGEKEREWWIEEWMGPLKLKKGPLLHYYKSYGKEGLKELKKEMKRLKKELEELKEEIKTQKTK